jgi:hypothetical protein
MKKPGEPGIYSRPVTLQVLGSEWDFFRDSDSDNGQHSVHQNGFARHTEHDFIPSRVEKC